MGYCTVYGDATGAFSPLGMYTTEEVIALGAELGLPENEEVLMILDLGYAAEGVGPLPNHASRKPLEETVVYC